MAEQFHVFISYAQADGEIAASVASALSDLGLRPFLAEKEIALGVNWENSIKEALCRSSVILCLITPRSKQSVWLHAEAGAAWVLDKPIVPALFEVEPNELIEILRLHQGRKIDSPEKLQSFLGEVAALVSKVSMLPLVEHASAAVISRDLFKPLETTLIESFTEARVWPSLLKIGPWSRDEITGTINGRGMHNYLLSANHYFPPFSIRGRLKFQDLHAVNKLDAVNAGIVIGWTTPRNVRRYFNLLFNEERIWLELIGDRGGDAYGDYQHLDSGIAFRLRAGETYEVDISVDHGQLNAVILGSDLQKWNYAVPLAEPPRGRVGLRPWRSRLHCELFTAVQL